MNQDGSRDGSVKPEAAQWQKLHAQLGTAPASPGVYIMKDAGGRVVYVGKAKNLKKRLATYFGKQVPDGIKVRMLVQRVLAFDTIVTEDENAALILESNLIKKHRPRYNVVLKDDKRYPSLRLRVHVPFPNLEVVRKIRKKDPALYFGPYSSATAMRETLKIINKHFKIRKCKDSVFRTRSRPCLFHQMGACLGPCCLAVDPSEYRQIVEEVVLFLKGRTPDLIRMLTEKMHRLAEQQAFERAAELRDRIQALERVVQQQVVISRDFVDRDVIGLAHGTDRDVITVLSVRNGYLNGSRSFPLEEAVGEPEDLVSGFLLQYYRTRSRLPREILVPLPIRNVPQQEALLSEMHAGRRVRIHHPRRGEKTRILEMANQNAFQELERSRSSVQAMTNTLERLQKRLGLPGLPRRIECIDNSNLSGQHPVSAVVVFENGLPLKSGYRKYRIRTSPEQNDYAYMKEVVNRRYGKQESASMPDLLMVDGGKGQLGVTRAVLADLGLWGTFHVIGIAKKDEMRGETEDKIYQIGRANPVDLSRDPEVLLLLQRIRDEAHRSVIGFHRKQRNRSALFSALDAVKGVGRARKAALIAHFGTVRRIREADVGELAAVSGIGPELARTIHTVLREIG